ncbi:ciliary neurotrophic factor isoform X2 [Engraulis encrasicolus]|uniref:ciliary neurotrophic factor isoform X2 n=1 Tax=Engraulis encrasicolus TaxID=184585 RepID=UPI002FD6A906
MAGKGENGKGAYRGKSVQLARLLNAESVRLLDLYKQRESFPQTAISGERLVSVPCPTPHLPMGEKVLLVHTALGQCQGLLDRAIVLEDTEMGLTGDKDCKEYLGQRKIVKERLGHLLQSTRGLLVDGVGTTAAVAGQARAEEPDGGLFALKVWIYRIIQDVVYWTNMASETLPMAPMQAVTQPRKMAKIRRKGKRTGSTEVMDIL